MNSELEKKTPAQPTGRRFSSVEEMMRVEGFSEEVQSKYKEIASSTRVATKLAKLRQKSGLTQEQMAEHLNVSQSAVSKLECGRDEDLTVGQIREYAKATGERIGMIFGKPPTHVESIKIYANGLRWHLSQLAKLARNTDELERDIQAFFGEAFFNILSILIESQSEMPNSNAIEVRLELLDHNEEGGSRCQNKPVDQEMTAL